MKSEITLKIKPELDDLYKSVSKVKKALQTDLSAGLGEAINKTAKSLSQNLSFKDIF